VQDKSARLLAELQSWIPEKAAQAVVAAANAHDIGHAHPIWQDALCELGLGELGGLPEGQRRLTRVRPGLVATWPTLFNA
jgi:hypothetical protein